MNLDQLKRLITTAFEGVGLGQGTSLLQIEVIGNMDALPNVTHEQYKSMLRQEMTQDWTLLKPATLAAYSQYFHHLDAAGFRYYIPACMMPLLEEYGPVYQFHSDIHILIRETFYLLVPEKEDSRWRDVAIQQYALLNKTQCGAIAQFLYWLPRVVAQAAEYEELAREAIANYWHQYLHTLVCAIEFELADAERFQRLQDNFMRFKWDKENKTRTPVEDWLLYFDDQALSHFHWPTTQENADLWQQWYLTSVEERRDNPAFFAAPWHFEFWLEAIYDADYRLESCELQRPRPFNL